MESPDENARPSADSPIWAIFLVSCLSASGVPDDMIVFSLVEASRSPTWTSVNPSRIRKYCFSVLFCFVAFDERHLLWLKQSSCGCCFLLLDVSSF